jgi:hypothetical protein
VHFLKPLMPLFKMYTIGQVYIFINVYFKNRWTEGCCVQNANMHICTYTRMIYTLQLVQILHMYVHCNVRKVLRYDSGRANYCIYGRRLRDLDTRVMFGSDVVC